MEHFNPNTAPGGAVYGAIPNPWDPSRRLAVPGILDDPLGASGTPGLFTGAGNPLRVAGRELVGVRQRHRQDVAGRIGGASPDLASIQPNVPLTNIVVDKFIEGGWAWPKIIPTKRIPVESYKWLSNEGSVDAKVVTTPERSIGGVGNVVIGPTRQWTDGRTRPWQLRAFFTDEELRDTANPATVRLSRVRRLIAAMNYAIEMQLRAALDTASIPGGQVSNWTVPFTSALTTISKDARNMKAAYQLAGAEPNFMFFDTIDTYNAWIDSAELRRDYQGFYFRQVIGGANYDPDTTGTPFLDLVPIVPRARFDNAPFSTTFSPARVWSGDSNGAGVVYFGFSPSLAVQPGGMPMDWDGESPTWFGGFQTAQGNTAPFQVYEMLDPAYQFNKVHWLGLECYRTQHVIDGRLIYALAGAL